MLEPLRTVIRRATESFLEGEESHNLRFRFCEHEFDQRLHRNAAPLRYAARTLDAVMHRDVLDDPQSKQNLGLRVHPL